MVQNYPLEMPQKCLIFTNYSSFFYQGVQKISASCIQCHSDVILSKENWTFSFCSSLVSSGCTVSYLFSNNPLCMDTTQHKLIFMFHWAVIQKQLNCPKAPHYLFHHKEKKLNIHILLNSSAFFPAFRRIFPGHKAAHQTFTGSRHSYATWI